MLTTKGEERAKFEGADEAFDAHWASILDARDRARTESARRKHAEYVAKLQSDPIGTRAAEAKALRAFRRAEEANR